MRAKQAPGGDANNATAGGVFHGHMMGDGNISWDVTYKTTLFICINNNQVSIFGGCTCRNTSYFDMSFSGVRKN